MLRPVGQSQLQIEAPILRFFNMMIRFEEMPVLNAELFGHMHPYCPGEDRLQCNGDPILCAPVLAVGKLVWVQGGGKDRI